MSSGRNPRSPPEIVVSDEVPEAEDVFEKDDALYEHQSDDSGSAGNILGELLRANSISRPDQDNPPMFWPENLLKKHLTAPHVKEAFDCVDKLRHLAGSVDYILATHFKILAILALMEKLKYLDKFMKNKVCDKDLPLIKCTKGNPVACNIARRTVPGKALDFLYKWSIDQRESFLRWQHCVTPPILTMVLGEAAEHKNFPSQTIMPWMSTLKQKEEGGYSQVFEVEIHPDCHDFHAVLASLSVRAHPRLVPNHVLIYSASDQWGEQIRYQEIVEREQSGCPGSSFKVR
jgi:hypothetical protein